MAEEDQDEDVTQEKKKKPILLIAIAALVLLGGGGGAAFFLMGNEDANAAVEEESVADAEGEETLTEAYYFSLDPPFVVNFSGTSRARFLQVSIEGLTRDSKVKEDITKHIPQVRNNIVLLLSSKTYDELSTQDGKKGLRKEVLKEIQKILEAETGKEGVEDVFFTSFVMQ